MIASNLQPPIFGGQQYLKRHMEQTSSTSSICFPHDSDSAMHKPL